MKEVSLANAKARFSELVDDAEHHGKRTLILRRGKPAAVLVPVEVSSALKRVKRSPAQIDTLLDRWSKLGDMSVSAVEDLLQSRR